MEEVIRITGWMIGTRRGIVTVKRRPRNGKVSPSLIHKIQTTDLPDRLPDIQDSQDGCQTRKDQRQTEAACYTAYQDDSIQASSL